MWEKCGKHQHEWTSRVYGQGFRSPSIPPAPQDREATHVGEPQLRQSSEIVIAPSYCFPMTKSTHTPNSPQILEAFRRGGRSVRSGLGPSGFTLGAAGWFFGWHLVGNDLAQADVVLQTAMTPLGVFAAVVLATAVANPPSSHADKANLHHKPWDSTATCAAAAIVAFMSCLVTIGLSEGATKAGSAVGTFAAIGLVTGSLITLLARTERLANCADNRG